MKEKMGPKNKRTQKISNFNICAPWSTTPPRVVFFSKEKMFKSNFTFYSLWNTTPPGVVFFFKEKMSQNSSHYVPSGTLPPWSSFYSKEKMFIVLKFCSL